MQEEEFISKLKTGDRYAFWKLVEDYKDQVYNTCLGLLQNLQDAEDVSQEVFMEVYQSIDSFNENSKLSTWIYRISVTKSLELIRYRKRKKRSAFFRAIKNQDHDISTIEDKTTFVHPGVKLENKERAMILMKAIKKLPEQQRIAFTLHKIEVLSYIEISRIMEKSVSAVEALTHRAKQNLKRDLLNYYKSDFE